MPLRILGGGANVLVPDEGVDALVVHMGKLRLVAGEGDRLHAWAGATLPGLVLRAARAGLSGLEGFVGIPGTVGGALRMNAGGRYGEFTEVIETLDLVEETGVRRTLRREDLRPVYRDGGLNGSVVLGATLRLTPGEREKIEERTSVVLAEKSAAQPLQERSAGCIWRNPPNGSAGRLVEDAGCKGWREGDAVVSEKHGNFVVNRGLAAAADVLRLLERVEGAVAEKTGVRLEREIVVW